MARPGRIEYPLLGSLAVLIAVFSVTVISDYDFWWHLKLGSSVLHTGAITGPDAFSYTFEGRPQFAGEWLADLLIYLSYAAAGLFGANLLKAAALFLTFFFLFKAINEGEGEGASPLIAGVLTLAVVLFSMRFRLFLRPFIFSYLFVAFFLFVLARTKRGEGAWLLFSLPVVEAVWANMSKGAFYGPALLLLFVAGEFLKKRPYKGPLIVLALVAAASLLGPEGYGLYAMPFKRTPVEQSYYVGEYQALSLDLLWGYGFRYTWAFQALVLLSAVYLVFFRGWRDFYHAALFVVFLVPTFTMVRMIDFFSLAASVLAARAVKGLLRPAAGLLRRAAVPAAAAVSAALVVVAAVSAAAGTTYPFGVGVKEDAFPEEALAFLDAERVKGALFNSFSLGGYIIWRAPERKVFIDGRGIHQLYSGEFFNSYKEMLVDPSAWRTGEGRWGFDYALLEYDIKEDRAAFPLHLNGNPSWALVWWDNHSAVYLKRTPENMRTIAAREYKVAKPNFYDFSYLEVYARHGGLDDAIVQVDREIAMNPSNQEPRLAKAFLLHKKRDPAARDEAIMELTASFALKPDLAMEHSAAALLYYEKGDAAGAAREAEKALAIDPSDKAGDYIKGKLKAASKNQMRP